MTSSVAGSRISSKALPKAKLAPKKCHGYSLVACCQSDPVQPSGSSGNHYTWEVCSANQWDDLKTLVPAARVGQQNELNSSPWQCPTICHTSNPSKLKLGYEVLPYPPYSPDLPPINYHFIKHSDNFLLGKCFPSICQILKHISLPYRNKQTCFTLAKICWL